VGLRATLDGRKFSSPPGFDPGPSSPYSVAIPTELPGPPHTHTHTHTHIYIYNQTKDERMCEQKGTLYLLLPSLD